MTAASSRWGRVVLPVAIGYLLVTGAVFFWMFGNPMTDDFAGWVPALVLLQIVWCALLGRPGPSLGRGRAIALAILTALLVALILLAVLLSVADLIGGTSWLSGVTVIALALSAVGFATPRFIAMATARPTLEVSTRLLVRLTIAALLGMALGAACLALTPERGQIFAGILAILAIFTTGLVLVFTIAPWLWALVEYLARPPLEPAPPVATARLKGSR
jgi:hypothetical protein